VMLDWMAKIIDLPVNFHSTSSEGGGVIQGTASEAILVALVSARLASLKRMNLQMNDSDGCRKLIIYVSDQTHSSAKKACMIAGFPLENIHVIPTLETNLCLTGESVKTAITEDRNRGLIPSFCVVTIGTTGTGSIDHLDEIAKICLLENVWCHVDGAWAGSACVCPEFQYLMKGVESCDSFSFNPHKWLLIGFDCSLLWIKNKNALISALSITPEYLRNRASETGQVTDYRDWQIPLGRRFRSLKIWFTIRTYGVNGLRQHIRNGIKMAESFEEWIKNDNRFEQPFPRSLTLILFRLKNQSNETNKRFLDSINATGKLMMTHTIARDLFVIRMAIGSSLTTLQHLENCWKIIQSCAEKILNE